MFIFLIGLYYFKYIEHLCVWLDRLLKHQLMCQQCGTTDKQKSILQLEKSIKYCQINYKWNKMLVVQI